MNGNHNLIHNEAHKRRWSEKIWAGLLKNNVIDLTFYLIDSIDYLPLPLLDQVLMSN